MEQVTKRGRPRVTNPELDALLTSMLLNGVARKSVSRRTVLNHVWSARALRGLDQASPMFAWYMEPGHTTALAELGRIEDDEVRLELLEHIYDKRLTTAKAVALIRRFRTGNDVAPVDRLVDSLIAAINAHLTRYPKTSANDIIEALVEAQQSVQCQPFD